MADLVSNTVPHAQIIRRADMIISHWAGGSTTQLAIHPKTSSVAAQDFLWRFSSATVEQDGAFTLFPAHQRLLALRQGAGFSLQVDQHQVLVDSRYHTLRFAGKSRCQAQLTAGAITDINLMLAAGFQGNLQALPLQCDWQTLELSRPAHSSLLFWSDELDVEIETASQHWLLPAGDVLQLAHWPQSSALTFRASGCRADASVVVAWFYAES